MRHLKGTARISLPAGMSVAQRTPRIDSEYTSVVRKGKRAPLAWSHDSRAEIVGEDRFGAGGGESCIVLSRK